MLIEFFDVDDNPVMLAGVSRVFPSGNPKEDFFVVNAPDGGSFNVSPETAEDVRRQWREAENAKAIPQPQFSHTQIEAHGRAIGEAIAEWLKREISTATGGHGFGRLCSEFFADRIGTAIGKAMKG